MRSPGSEPPNYLTRKWALLTLLLASPLYVLFAYLGDEGRARAAALAGAAIIGTTRSRWDLRKHAWFWATIMFLILLHGPVILLIHWTNENIPAPALLPFVLLDFVIMYGCIKVVEKMMT
jgi:hypothetical protein